MKNKQREDVIENKKTLDFLLNITEMLKSSDAIIGRNDEMFALDANKASKLLNDENLDLGSLFVERQLIVDHDDIFGVMSPVPAYFKNNNIVFCDVAREISRGEVEKVNYPHIEDVKNWFLSIPKFSEKDKKVYEDYYQQSKDVFNEVISENSDEIFKAIFSLDGTEIKSKKKLHRGGLAKLNSTISEEVYSNLS